MRGEGIPAGPPSISKAPLDGAEFINSGSGDGTGGSLCCGPKCVVGADLEDVRLAGGAIGGPLWSAACIGMGVTMRSTSTVCESKGL
jgi:hypothetical protein